MNNTADGPEDMATDTAMMQPNSYGQEPWSNISPYSQSPYGNSPMNEYANFGQYLSHGLPQEPLNRMPPPPSQQQHQHGQHQVAQSPSPMSHAQLPMLNTTWPSQLIDHSHSSSYSAPSKSIAPVPTAPSSTETLSKPAPNDKARKTLSAEQKRAMCQYHEDNPGTRQADIGAKFGVERSTVSKVLRHKEQYLKRDQEPEPANGKRIKAKYPDFDRTLSNYVRRQHQRGFDIQDDEILEQARMFAHASGNQDAILSSLTSSWLQKFKQKHGIGTGRLVRRASEPNIPDNTSMSRTPHGLSPASPTRQLSPLSGSRSDEDGHPDGAELEFTYRQAASYSNASLSEMPASSFSNDNTISPHGQFGFSPDPNTGSFHLDSNLHLPHAAPEFYHREKRSNTFPSLGLDFTNQPQHLGSDPLTPRHLPPSTLSSSSLDSPAHELNNAPFPIDTAIVSSPGLRRTTSNSSISARTSGNPIPNGTVPATTADSSPVSPTQDEARRAAATLLSYIQNMGPNGQYESEYMSLMQLTKRLQIHHGQQAQPRLSVGGLSRIPESETECSAPMRATMN